VKYLSAPCFWSFLWITMIWGREDRTGLYTKMIGEWRSVSIEIKMHTAFNSDSTRYLRANEDNWEQVTKVKPVQTYFKPDGTYYAEYHDLRDSIVYHPSGEWSVKEDSLIVRQLSPKPATLRYRVVIKDDLGEFRSILDFDGDGKADDEFF
jgi:hypothetical protein